MKNPLIVYHGPSCLDGMAAAWCMHQRFGNNAEYIVGRYQSDDVIDFAERDVYLVDFSYPVDFLKEKVLPVANKVVLIDHHKSALDALEGLDRLFDNFDMSHSSNSNSGAMLAWRYIWHDFHPSGSVLKMPRLLQIIEDRDLWQFKLEDTKAVTAALFARDLTFETIDEFMQSNEKVSQLRVEGEILLKAHMSECANLIKYATRVIAIPFADQELGVITVNASPKYASDIGNLLSLEYPLAMTYWDSENHREFSLRSNKDNPEHVDVSVIASIFGGGGHKHAAGFKVSRDHELAKY